MKGLHGRCARLRIFFWMKNYMTRNSRRSIFLILLTCPRIHATSYLTSNTNTDFCHKPYLWLLFPFFLHASWRLYPFVMSTWFLPLLLLSKALFPCVLLQLSRTFYPDTAHSLTCTNTTADWGCHASFCVDFIIGSFSSLSVHHTASFPPFCRWVRLLSPIHSPALLTYDNRD